MGIDGWRLDVATEVDSHFWREFRETVRGINPDALIIGEFWRNSEAWLQGDQYDGVMNYGVQRAAVEYFAKSAVAPQRFQELLTENLMRPMTLCSICWTATTLPVSLRSAEGIRRG